MLTHPLLKAGVSFTVRLILDERESEAVISADAAKIEIDHLRPGAGVDIGFSVWIGFVHGVVSVSHDDGMNICVSI